jgi:hypothetical protein
VGLLGDVVFATAPLPETEDYEDEDTLYDGEDSDGDPKNKGEEILLAPRNISRCIERALWKVQSASREDGTNNEEEDGDKKRPLRTRGLTIQRSHLLIRFYTLGYICEIRHENSWCKRINAPTCGQEF